MFQQSVHVHIHFELKVQVETSRRVHSKNLLHKNHKGKDLSWPFPSTNFRMHDQFTIKINYFIK